MNFVFDLDGTICFQGKPVSEPILSCLERIRTHGHHVIFATARPIRDALPILHERFHTYPIIGGNGSLLYEQGNLVNSNHFTNYQMTNIKKLIQKYHATYLIDGEWDYAYTGSEQHPILQRVDPHRLAKKVELQNLEHIIKALILTASDFAAFYQELNALGVVIHQHKNENVLDISPKDVHKWSALQALGIQDYIAFGNDANDITMFQHAKHSVMIGYHEKLATYASETIAVEEEKIVEKVYELVEIYTSHSQSLL